MRQARNPPPVVALEISALASRAHSGISNVTKAMAREMLSDPSIDAKFFLLRGEVPRDVVERFIALEGGDILWWIGSRLDARPNLASSRDCPHIAIYPLNKRHRRLFPTEVLIVHDLTAIVTPQFHTQATIEDWRKYALADMLSSDLLVAVSDSTKDDIRSYLPQMADIPCMVAKIAPFFSSDARRPPEQTSVNYVLVLGTLEPRKNVRLILETLAEYPDLLEEAKFVFVGQKGWGESAAAAAAELGLSQQIADGKIVFPGFVSNAARDLLLSSARLVIYPSRYEGFGLPVAEALAFGAPVLTSYSSSMPEAGGDLAHYGDIDSPAEFYAAICSQLRSESSAEARRARMDWASRFAWRTTYENIRDAALGIAAGREVYL